MEDSDYLFMIGCLKRIADNYSLRVYAFCLMPNHVHLLLSPTESNLYDAMRDLFSRYAMKFNKKYERKGHLFGGPYRQAVCLDDSYLLAASLYIHLNPVKAGLATDPLAYRWSSCRLYYDDNAPKSFIDPDFILGLLSGDKLGSKKRYRDLLRQGSELQTAHVLEQEDAIERFRLKLVSIFPSLFKMIDGKKQIAKFLGIDLTGMEELEKHLPAIAFARPPSALPQANAGLAQAKRAGIETVAKEFPNSKPESRKAKKYLIEQLIARGYTRAEIADRLSVSRKTVYNILKSSL